MSIRLRSKPEALLAQTVQIRQHQLTTDISTTDGGADDGPDPHDLYDAAVGACKALTLMWYARKKGMDVSHVDTRVERDASAERQGVYKLATIVSIQGAVSDEELAQLNAVASKCPVHKLMTSVTTEISTLVERAP